MEKVMRSVERSVAAEMAKKFAIIFDGWSHDSDHYVVVFARYEVVRSPLLYMTPLVSDETDDLSAATHRAFLASMLSRDYQSRLNQCISLVGDKVNRRLATSISVPLVACASHRLNRAVTARLSECAEYLEMLQVIIIKLRSLHRSAKLRFIFFQN
ncbi:LOW QUALITY PROTEIN: Hypothetical protein PHPALM_5874 [Phytophthora palmivora]|uniref:Uncharacterized protein n=1 Tax=Phytophthora palmivora TaxID=4796 RepID=A0A2P4YGB8_9STRA|nr:LOW QUALITY PROTEIN: Hypothetical protein PHPALM_5874 [Phytophthora palmivora]